MTSLFLFFSVLTCTILFVCYPGAIEIPDRVQKILNLGSTTHKPESVIPEPVFDEQLDDDDVSFISFFSFTVITAVKLNNTYLSKRL